MNGIIDERLTDRKVRIAARLDKGNFPDDLSQPVLRGPAPRYELAERTVATAYGGIGLVHQLVRDLGLAEAIDERLHMFKQHRPYHESDHVLNFAYNALCEGRCLEDLELRRQDEAFLDLLGAVRIPDPTTAGDFCRRFTPAHLDALHAAIDVARRRAWSTQPEEFFAEARIEADGALVETAAECKQGIDISYKGLWSYHPYVLTLANTGEVLRLYNRSGNRPSHEGAAARFDECIALSRQAGFRRIVLRGDTDFSQTQHLDRWHAQGVVFVFGYDRHPTLEMQADDLPATAWTLLSRPAKYKVQTEPRTKPERVKQQIVEQREFKDVRLVDEWVAEFEYQPHACRRSYRMVVVRKNLEVKDPQQGRLFSDYRYFYYITNDTPPTPGAIVLSANKRCQQENVLAQLRAVRALHAPVDNLTSNGAYMLMTALAWNLKAWLALQLPVDPEPAPQSPQKRRPPTSPAQTRPAQPARKQTLLGMEFRTFVNRWMRIPCQVVHTGGQVVLRLLAWNDWLPDFFRLAAALRTPLRR